ncbi:MAG: hypothetical protein KAW51_00490, partial [Candidatus Lokiarchaeota archaeon]|nr:hypothetical protein [Candidatus Lokiarchaeota archaeon]
MSKKVYVCRECNFKIPDELSHLIESNIQVFCERCGSPFIMEGITFKPATTPYRKFKKPTLQISQIKSSSLEKAIQTLNKISFIPLFIFTCISFGLIAEIAINWDAGLLFDRIMHGLLGLFILIYDRTHIARKVREKKYNDIFLDAFCWGILGSILYGLGVIILIKGVLIMIYVITDSNNEHFKKYDYGLLAKNSLNNFSAKAGFVIVLFGIYRVFSDRIYLPEWDTINIDLPFGILAPARIFIYLNFLLFALVILIIDSRLKNDLNKKQKFMLGDAIKFLVLGILGTIFYAAGIFILLKGVLIFFLFVSSPTEEIQKIPITEKQVYYAPAPPTPPSPPIHPMPAYKKIEEPQKEIPEERAVELKEVEEKPVKAEPQKIEEITVKKLEKIPIKIDKKEKAKREKEFKLKLHDSLLPVKNEKDKKLVKEYFAKIFAVLSKDLRKQIIDLKISKKEKKELLEELVFLTNEEQIKYIEAIVNMYKEIPKRLIARIRKLPNVRPKHYDRILDQLKYMDYEEQIKFVQFLEENA